MNPFWCKFWMFCIKKKKIFSINSIPWLWWRYTKGEWLPVTMVTTTSPPILPYSWSSHSRVWDSFLFLYQGNRCLSGKTRSRSGKSRGWVHTIHSTVVLIWTLTDAHVTWLPWLLLPHEWMPLHLRITLKAVAGTVHRWHRCYRVCRVWRRIGVVTAATCPVNYNRGSICVTNTGKKLHFILRERGRRSTTTRLVSVRGPVPAGTLSRCHVGVLCLGLEAEVQRAGGRAGGSGKVVFFCLSHPVRRLVHLLDSGTNFDPRQLEWQWKRKDIKSFFF